MALHTHYGQVANNPINADKDRNPSNLVPPLVYTLQTWRRWGYSFNLHTVLFNLSDTSLPSSVSWGVSPIPCSLYTLHEGMWTSDQNHIPTLQPTKLMSLPMLSKPDAVDTTANNNRGKKDKPFQLNTNTIARATTITAKRRMHILILSFLVGAFMWFLHNCNVYFVSSAWIVETIHEFCCISVYFTHLDIHF